MVHWVLDIDNHKLGIYDFIDNFIHGNDSVKREENVSF